MIPDEAVEAAAKVLWEPNERDDEWVGEYETYKDYLRAQAIKVLEAAAPYMLATNKPEKEVSTGTLIRKLLDEARADG